MFDAYLRQRIAPLIERLAELETQIEDLLRRSEGQTRIGTIAAVNPAAGVCQVSHGDLLSPWIKYFNPAAGEVSEARHPSPGEQCLLLNYAGGDGSAQALALLGVPSAAFPIASTAAELHRRTYPDGTEARYDHAASVLDWINGPTSVKADRTGIELLSNGSGLRIDAAGVHLVGPKVDHDGVDIGKTHPHLDLQNAAVATGRPKP